MRDEEVEGEEVEGKVLLYYISPHLLIHAFLISAILNHVHRYDFLNTSGKLSSFHQYET